MTVKKEELVLSTPQVIDYLRARAVQACTDQYWWILANALTVSLKEDK